MVTAEYHPSYDLIRFVCSPDGQIIPDVAAKLPGRGCWVLAKRQILEDAIKRKLFLRFGSQALGSKKKNDIEELEENLNEDKKTSILVRDDLVDQVEGLLHKRCLDYLGLANRAGNVLTGFEKVRTALKSFKTNVLFVSSDCAENGRNKITQGLDNLQVFDMFARNELSQAVGMDNVVHLAIMPGGIRTGLLRELSRYENCRKRL